MPTLRSLPQGRIPSMGGNANAVPPDRTGTAILSWSGAAVRRNIEFLMTVDHAGLTGYGYAFTLTVRQCPYSPGEWGDLRNALFHRLRRLGLVRLHWVTEWQRRRVPHLHLAVYFASQVDPGAVLRAWLEVTAHLGSVAAAQSWSPIFDALGWSKYVSKHASRGLRHYQRSPELVPPQWQSGTGRMWGKLGSWPVGVELRFELSKRGFWMLRRVERRARLGVARRMPECRAKRREVVAARRWLRCPYRKLSEVRSTGSRWGDQASTLRLVEWLCREGVDVASV